MFDNQMVFDNGLFFFFFFKSQNQIFVGIITFLISILLN